MSLREAILHVRKTATETINKRKLDYTEEGLEDFFDNLTPCLSDTLGDKD